MNVNDFSAGAATLKADEVPAGATMRLTISGFDEQSFSNDDGSETHRAVILFDGKDKGIATGVLNLREVARVYGDDMDTWIGRELDIHTAIKGNDKLGFVMRGVAEGGGAPTDDIPF